MTFLRFLEGLRNPVLDAVMQAITELGGETVFLAIALILYWCVDKHQGYYMMAVGFLGTIANQFLKITCQIPRPWVLDPQFTIVESARADATGYSFPSGHSQSSVGTFLILARMPQLRQWKWAFGAACVLVPFSRMYLGVHTPLDVLVASGMAVLLVLGLEKVCLQGKLEPVFWGCAAVAGAFVVYLECFPFPADTDPANYAGALKNGYTLFGAVCGLIGVHHLDNRNTLFDPRCVWYGQIAKVVLGLFLVLALLSGLKIPMNAIFGDHCVKHFFRYGLVVLVAGWVWPMSFPWFSRWGRKDEVK